MGFFPSASDIEDALGVDRTPEQRAVRRELDKERAAHKAARRENGIIHQAIAGNAEMSEKILGDQAKALQNRTVANRRTRTVTTTETHFEDEPTFG